MRKIIKLMSAVTSTTSSGSVDILGAKRVVLLADRSTHTSGSATITAKVGVGATLVDYKKWISNATNSNAQGLTRVANLVLSSKTGDFITMSPEDSFEFIKVTDTELGSGATSVWLIVDYEDDIK
jgi:hypothetical protein